MESLTEKQKKVLEYIGREVERCNYPPSVREIGKALGISSTATVHGYLDILQKKGYISRMATKPRAIQLMRDIDGAEERKCAFAPLVGRITAGLPILAEENREGYFPVPTQISAGEDCFVLNVSGESMKGAGIHDGDFVMIRHQHTANNGEIVAVMLDDEATVKRIYFEDGGCRLQPENDAFEPIIVKGDVDILGRVIGLFRRV